LHINILKPDGLDKAEFLKACQRVDKILFEQLQRMGGSISAEHGVGLVKKPFLSFARSNEEIAIFKQIKTVFDPDGIMNPGKIF
jgi:FAD/FMN-containing dehydrogenase